MADRPRLERAAVGVFFVSLAIVGLVVYDDYGISWDEPGLVDYGRLLLDHYAPGGEWETYLNLRFYGPVGPVALALTERVAGGEAFPAGHLTNFALFFAGVVAFYALCRYQFESRLWGLAGAAALVLSPRVFSHGMVNPKDMPLMTTFVVAVYLLIRFLDSRGHWWMLGCGAATALAVGVRIGGLFIVALVLLGISADVIARRERASMRRTAVSVALYLCSSAALAFALWPFLWEDPWGRLRETISLMANFLDGPLVVLYFGRVVPVIDLPWHYLPVWIGITTPPLITGLAVVGIGAAGAPTLQGFRERTRDRFFLVHLAWLLVPLAAIALRRPPLYDEWRQVLFIYPAMLLFTLAGARWVGGVLAARRRARLTTAIAAAIVACSAVWTLVVMVRLHPYQTAYFNVLAGNDADEEFEVDYWGLSYKEGQERLLALDPGTVTVFVCGGPGKAVAQMLPPQDAARLDYVESVDQAEYSLCAPRATTPLRPTGEPLFTIERDDLLLLEAYRLS